MAQGAQRFHISETNPNDAVGGGGCVCGDSKQEDCQGPFAVFYATETDSNLSPHVVLSLGCAQAVVAAGDGETLHAGEPTPVIDVHDAVEIVRPPVHENPVAEDAYPDLDAIDEELSI